MRSQQQKVRNLLTRSAVAILNARYGVWFGAAVAAGLLTLLLHQTYLSNVMFEGQPLTLEFTASPGHPYDSTYDGLYLRLEALPRNNGYLDRASNLYTISLSSDGSVLASDDLSWRLTGSSKEFILLTPSSATTELRVAAGIQNMGDPILITRRYDAIDGGAINNVAWSDTGTAMVVWGAKGATSVITPTGSIDSVITEYQSSMLQNSATTLGMKVDRFDAVQGHSISYGIAQGDERTTLTEPLLNGLPSSPISGTTLAELATLFSPDVPIRIVAQLNATTFEKDPQGEQQVLYHPSAPIHFQWNLKPLEEGEQDLSVRLFLEGVPLNGTEPLRIPIYAATIHTQVGVPMFSYGAPIAIYTTLYTALAFLCGGLATWGAPRLYALALSIISKWKPIRSPPPRQGSLAATAQARQQPRKSRRRR